MSPALPFRGRFAPSPTGRMHLGNVRSALLGWLQARHAGGEFLLRIEDLDRARCRPEHTAALLDDLRWLGLTWDGEVLVQSARTAVYDAALERLRAAGRLYPCFCTRAEVLRAASAPHGAGDEGPRYPGTCARLTPAEAAARAAASARPPALRFRAAPGPVAFTDGVAGPQVQDVEAEVGDFVVRRNDGVASYQLAVVVDDAASGVTDVLRGADLLSSTARQLQLYAALGLPPPRFHHVGLVVGEDGKRLAKREGAVALAELRARGVSAEAVLGVLAAMSGLGDGAPVALPALLARFRPELLRAEPVVVAEAALARALGLG